MDTSQAQPCCTISRTDCGYHSMTLWAAHGWEHDNQELHAMDSNWKKAGMIILGNTFTSGATFLYNLAALVGNFVRTCGYLICCNESHAKENASFMRANLKQLGRHAIRLIPFGIGYGLTLLIDKCCCCSTSSPNRSEPRVYSYGSPVPVLPAHSAIDTNPTVIEISADGNATTLDQLRS